LEGLILKELFIKAIKRTKKVVTICSHADPAEPAPPTNEEPPSREAPAADTASSPADIPPATEPQVNPPVEQDAKLQMNNTPMEVCMVHEYAHDFSLIDHRSSNPYYHYSMNGMRPYESYSYATHSYNL
jgi:hypothetical protein